MLSFLGEKVSLSLVEYEVMEKESYDQKLLRAFQNFFLVPRARECEAAA